MASWPAPGSRRGKGNRPNGVGLGRPSWAQSTGLDWARRVGLTRLQTTGLLGGGMFPAQHMAGRDRGRSIGQASPRCGVGVVPGAWGLGRCGLGAANLLGPLIPGQLVVPTRLHHHHQLLLLHTSTRPHVQTSNTTAILCPSHRIASQPLQAGQPTLVTNAPYTVRPTSKIQTKAEPESSGPGPGRCRSRQAARCTSLPR